jgi:hypothetical protein
MEVERHYRDALRVEVDVESRLVGAHKRLAGLPLGLRLLATAMADPLDDLERQRRNAWGRSHST